MVVLCLEGFARKHTITSCLSKGYSYCENAQLEYDVATSWHLRSKYVEVTSFSGVARIFQRGGGGGGSEGAK